MVIILEWSKHHSAKSRTSRAGSTAFVPIEQWISLPHVITENVTAISERPLSQDMVAYEMLAK